MSDTLYSQEELANMQELFPEPKVTQHQIVKHHLEQYGFVTRNWCLRQYITRLSAIIYDLKKEGMQIESVIRDNGNYIYEHVKGAYYAKHRT